MKIKRRFLIAFLLSFFYFIIHLVIINDYGLSWDFHYHFYAGLHHLGLSVPSISEIPSVPFTSPDPRLTIDDPFGPFTQIIPTFSYLIFYEKLHILPFDSAYNFPMMLVGSLGVGLLFLFLSEAIGTAVAFFSSLFLALLPSYFGYLHNNMKDIPSAFTFILCIYLFWKLVKKRRAKDLIFAVFSFALAFNTKINAILIPVVCFVWYVLIDWRNILKVIRGKIILYFILSPLVAVLLWLSFWKDPIGKLLELPHFYSRNTLNMPVLFMGKIFRSGINIPWYYPFVYIFIKMPIPILFSFVIGLFICWYKILKKKDNFSLLLVVWFFLPLLRYSIPKAGAIDGIRHFMEVVYPLCAIAGVGFVATCRYLNKVIKKRNCVYFVIPNLFRNPIKILKQVQDDKVSVQNDDRNRKKLTTFILSSIIFVLLVINIIHFHPYQTSFFNSFIGGIKGAEGKFDIDFWGTPQKETMFWLNKNAKLNAVVRVVMAQSSAGMYLREDLRKIMNSKDIWESDYTVVLNKESFFSLYPVVDYIKKKTKENKLVFTRKIDGVPLVWVFKR